MRYYYDKACLETEMMLLSYTRFSVSIFMLIGFMHGVQVKHRMKSSLLDELLRDSFLITFFSFSSIE
jgi:hypothetical protein